MLCDDDAHMLELLQKRKCDKTVISIVRTYKALYAGCYI